jgi:5-methylthioadenosine/S-adenosylhomocysteine deaminase
MKHYDLSIKAGILLTMEEGHEEPLYNQWVHILGSQIAAIEPINQDKSAAPTFQSKKIIDSSESIVMPGLINSHGHLPMTLFRGLADDLPFQKWLMEYIVPLEARLVSPEFVRLGTELAVLESIRTGVTSVYDMYYYEYDIAEVVDKLGIRAVLGQSILDFPAPDNKDKDGSDYKVLDQLLERYKGHARITPIIAPHAPYTCSDETLTKARDYALKNEIGIGIHVSETAGEVQGSLEQYKKTPVKRLHDLGVTKAKCLYAHCVHVTDEDIQLLKKDNVGVAHNPESNMKLGAGGAPVVKLLEAGVTVGIGSDGAASNNDLNVFREMDVAAKLQKMLNADNTAMTAIQSLRMATRNGAKCMCLEHTGIITPGYNADLISVSLEAPSMQPLHNVHSQLVYSTSGYDVEHTICHGKVLMEDYTPTGIDSKDLYSRIKKYREKVSL